MKKEHISDALNMLINSLRTYRMLEKYMNKQ